MRLRAVVHTHARDWRVGWRRHLTLGRCHRYYVSPSTASSRHKKLDFSGFRAVLHQIAAVLYSQYFDEDSADTQSDATHASLAMRLMVSERLLPIAEQEGHRLYAALACAVAARSVLMMSLPTACPCVCVCVCVATGSWRNNG